MNNNDFTDIVRELLASSSMLAELADLTSDDSSNALLLRATADRVQGAVERSLRVISGPDSAPTCDCHLRIVSPRPMAPQRS